MKQLITTELRQKQTISAQQYHSLRILQMNCAELDEYIRDAVLDNPVLELDETQRDTGMQSLDALREHMLWVQSQPVDYSGNAAGEEEAPSRLEWQAQDMEESLREHLESQFDASITEEEHRLLLSVINYLDSNGYLTADIPELARASGFSEELVGYAVSYIQTMDPLGVGARNLSECLCIQLEMLNYKEKAVYRIVQEHLEDMAVGRYNKIAREVEVSPQEVRRLCGVIRTLNPKPASSFGNCSTVPVIPDAAITLEDGEPIAILNERGTSGIYISGYYSRLAKQDEYGEAAAYLEEKLNQARWMIEAVESRKKTLRQIVEAIAYHQRSFFTSSTGELRPLTLREMAGKLGLHESTISRAISGKYLQCDRGAFPLKYFFAGRSGAGEESSSRNTVQARIVAFVSAEDPCAPLSDNRISELLLQDGIRLSRRAVAKYRQELGIPGTSVRRRE